MIYGLIRTKLLVENRRYFLTKHQRFHFAVEALTTLLKQDSESDWYIT